jgi:hypothetical protein
MQVKKTARQTLCVCSSNENEEDSFIISLVCGRYHQLLQWERVSSAIIIAAHRCH